MSFITGRLPLTVGIWDRVQVSNWRWTDLLLAVTGVTFPPRR